jgi:23S rRNA pseudouridine955/2504/2580 synthase
MTASNPLAPRLAQTRAFVRERRNGYSLVEVDLLTGRTHQIRVHLSSIGFPIVGDSVYGSTGINRIL